ncbi:MAG: hypothetical protein ACPHXR_04715 [Flavicella sp.]
MKKIFLLSILFSFLLFSCSSDEIKTTELTQEELIEINSKLSYLDVSALDNMGGDSDLESNTFLKSQNIKTDFLCSHELSYSDNYDGFTVEITNKYFDSNMEEITNCDAESSMASGSYYIFTEQKTVGINREYHLFSEALVSQKVSMTSFEITNKANIYGQLKIEDVIFEVLKGSYMNMVITMNLESSSLEDLLVPEINFLYKIEFTTDEDTYHFDMKLDNADLVELLDVEANNVSEEFSAKFILYNSSNSQVGFVKYIQNIETELERFELYDLNEQLVEPSR